MLNNRTDKEDEPDTNYDRIPLFGVVFTSNPAALKIPGYDFEEVEEDGTAGTDI